MLQLVLAVAAAAALGSAASAPSPEALKSPLTRIADAQRCVRDDQCDDGIWCNGLERCDVAAAGADRRGCAPPRGRPCLDVAICYESEQRCSGDEFCDTETERDTDRDGVTDPLCGGTDCDDDDFSRYPSDGEVWDRDNLDEDCNLDTNGLFEKPEFVELGQICSGTQVIKKPALLYRLFGGVNYRRLFGAEAPVRPDPPLGQNNTSFAAEACPMAGTVCIPQPNGAGVCAPPPPGYAPPPVLTAPYVPHPRRQGERYPLAPMKPIMPGRPPLGSPSPEPDPNRG